MPKKIYACLHSWPRKKEVTLGDIIEPELRTKTPVSSVLNKKPTSVISVSL